MKGWKITLKILSIDTASDICGVSILENNKLLINLDTNSGRTHSENLMPMIEKAFSNTNLSIKDMDLIVCDIGPGSFTGIRIGVATSKAFSDSLNIPCIGVSSLEILAYNIKNNLKNEDFVCSILDCKNDNCYYAIYQFKNDTLKEIIAPKADSIENFKNIVPNFEDKNITFVGDGIDIYKEYLSSLFKNAIFSKENILNSYSLGICGLEKFNNKQFCDVLPLYLKKPQAQRQLEDNLLKKL